jgi:hypothetical protein
VLAWTWHTDLTWVLSCTDLSFHCFNSRYYHSRRIRIYWSCIYP